jgi:anti-sigma B factor antagonist
MANLNAAIDRVDGETVFIALTGRMTLGMSLREVESKINHVAEDGATRKLILDLSGVEYADSAGLGLVMLLYGRMKTQGGQLRLVAPDAQLRNLFKITCTDTILTIDVDREAAMAG